MKSTFGKLLIAAVIAVMVLRVRRSSNTTLSLPIHIMIYRDWGTPMFSA